MTIDELRNKWHKFNPALLEHSDIDELIEQAIKIGQDQADEYLEAKLEMVQATVDVLSGKACKEEQERGKGPCGACQNCLRERFLKEHKIAEQFESDFYAAKSQFGDAMAKMRQKLREAEGKIAELQMLIGVERSQRGALQMTIQNEHSKLENSKKDDEKLIADLVLAMAMWGSWEDGVPESGEDEHGFVGKVFDQALSRLGMTKQSIANAVAVWRADYKKCTTFNCWRCGGGNATGVPGEAHVTCDNCGAVTPPIKNAT